MTKKLKPRFGIDIDGTVTCPATLIPHINNQYNVNITIADITEYDFLSGFPHPVDRNEFNQWFKANEPMMYEVSELAQDAKKILVDWQNSYELFYISARGENVFDVTQNWFKKHSLPFDHIELIGSHDKISVAKKHAVEVFFEDKHDNAVMIAEELSIPVILFDTPYNQMPAPTNVIRVNNWIEANDWIRKNY
ncbi:5' nucleotidase, NT5C type [Solibacillus sp. FSL H8-0538]|uniref:5' nucleotidase, NT5C type n=1 Tax=Solibacillus sp. FSL H8-0538 TaxID=2921400 RepID=UPI0030F540E4